MTLPPFDELPKRVTHDQMPLTSALLKLGSGQGIYFSSSFFDTLENFYKILTACFGSGKN